MAVGSWKHSVRISTEGDGHVQEDTCGYAGSTAWVIDGASSLLPQLGLPGPSDPAWYARNLDLLLTDAAVAAGVAPAPQVLAGALTRMDQLARTLAGEERIRFPSAALCLAQLTGDGVEILALADCHAVVELEDGSLVHVTHEPADIRIGTEHSADPVRERELRVLDRELRNTPGRLWVARREAEAAYQARTVRLGPARRVVLASDGAWRAVELGIVDGPGGFLAAAGSAVAAQELLLALRTLQVELGENADDATLLTLERISP
ncbi:protein phosphatase 2C domain-containing protein [Arthrobacter sp. zg-Y826]|uniref:protein phosphatase 2C domain-containing protein n=1 Tax=Arthrobacter jinronghuae TaxID=2964609 RepID=UPI0021083816|nr:protein phosphatase 2C domain-containing protein [Arthrobacter jinronghuae]MCQ1957920.1 protein phosphatase 2C domain-containing protein [Arthrobacter jinronghuae]